METPPPVTPDIGSPATDSPATDPPAETPVAPLTDAARREVMTLLASIFVIAACGLVFELLIATASSYLLGSSVTQFSIAIGIFVGAMGIGSHLSERVMRNLLGSFILIECLLAAVGGTAVCLLFWAYSAGWFYWVALYAALIIIGSLVGLELPLLTRMLKPYGSLRAVLARALSFDYLGALIGSIMFPLLLLPTLGMARTGFLIGLVNIGVAAWNATVFRAKLRHAPLLQGLCGVIALVMVGGFAFSLRLVSLAESRLYEDEIIYAAQTPYQRIVVTRWRDDLRLFIDGNLQFASPDEYRYHEALIHPAMALSPNVEKVLLLGGGDGLAVREVLKYPNVKSITLVDLDRQMTQLGQGFAAFTALNGNALGDKRVRIVNQDAHKFLEQDAALYDVIIGDLPDPNNDVLAKLYSVEFYKLVKRHLAASGVFATQATSPFFSREAFWCIAGTVEAGFTAPGDKRRPTIAPYHTYVPSFGDWGFVLAAPRALPIVGTKVTIPTKYLTPDVLREMFVFGADANKIAVDTSTLDRPAILNYYLHNWKQWE